MDPCVKAAGSGCANQELVAPFVWSNIEVAALLRIPYPLSTAKTVKKNRFVDKEVMSAQDEQFVRRKQLLGYGTICSHLDCLGLPNDRRRNTLVVVAGDGGGVHPTPNNTPSTTRWRC